MTGQNDEKAQPEYRIDGEWLVEVVNEHTCGTARGGYYGAHEPGCGMVPVGKVDDLLRDAGIGSRMEWLFAARPDTPCRTTWPDGIEHVEVPMDDLRAAFDPSTSPERTSP